jgi:hypothetical protein
VRRVLKGTAGTITAGQLVYITGYNTSEEVLEVELADASNFSTMPALGVARNTITDTNQGTVIVLGVYTGIDTSTYSVGDALYVSETAGAITNVRPTGSAIVQQIGKVASVSVTGATEIHGSYETADLPNLSEGNIWIGDSSSYPVETGFTDSVQDIIGLNLTSPFVPYWNGTNLTDSPMSVVSTDEVRFNFANTNADVRIVGQNGFDSGGAGIEFERNNVGGFTQGLYVPNGGSDDLILRSRDILTLQSDSFPQIQVEAGQQIVFNQYGNFTFSGNSNTLLAVGSGGGVRETRIFDETSTSTFESGDKALIYDDSASALRSIDFDDFPFAATVHTHVSTDITDFDEAAQDAVGAILINTATIDLTYTDGSDTIQADLNHLGIEDLTDPNDDAIMFWDDSAGNTDWLDLNATLTITGTTLGVVDNTSTQKVEVVKNSGSIVGTRKQLNFIEGSLIGLTVSDDAGNDQVDITIQYNGTTGSTTNFFNDYYIDQVGGTSDTFWCIERGC